MAIANPYNVNKYSAGNGVGDKVWGAAAGGIGLSGDLGAGLKGNTKYTAKSGGSFTTGGIGGAIDKAWGVTNSLIGDVYSRGRGAFDAGVLNTAYGKSSDDPFFGGIGRERNAKEMARGLANEGFTTTARNMGDLAMEAGDTSIMHSSVSDVSQGKKVGAVFQNAASGAAKGAKIGGNFGPWGLAIGAIAGGVGGIVSRLFGNRRAKRRLARINKAINYSNNLKGMQARTAVTNMGTMENNKLFANMAAYGGAQPVMRKYGAGRARVYADGGALAKGDDGGRKISQSKDDWPGITEINAGGSHEENPRGGVPQGVGPDGVPNLVEQGEVKISDIIGGGNQYVLSARLVIDAETAAEFGIDGRLVGKTFAEGFKEAYGKYKDRQGNAEVRNEVARLIDIFQSAQDAYKAKREAKEELSVMASLSPGERQAAMDAAAAQEAAARQAAQGQEAATQGQPMEAMPPTDGASMPMEEPMPQPAAPMPQQPMMGYGGYGRTVRKYDNGGRLRLKGGRARLAALPGIVEEDDPAEEAEYEALRSKFLASGRGGEYQARTEDADKARAARDRAWEDLGLDAERVKSKLDSAPMWAGLGAWLNSKKYRQDAGRYNSITREGMARSMVSPERLGGLYRPKYLNPDYANNALRSAAAQASRNAAMLSGGNRAAAAAAQSVALARANEARGQQLYNAQAANEQMRMQAAQMNDAKAQANAQMRLQADEQNAARTSAAYDKMMETEAAVDQYNKAMRLNLMQNAANLLGKYGVSARNRLTAGAMAANGLFGKGADSLLSKTKQ